MTTLDTEIRKLRPVELYSLAKILSPDFWKILMGNIKKANSLNEPMFTSDHIAMIETAAIKQRKLASEIFLDEWSTMGRVRPTVRTTIDLLVEVQLFRAADFLAVEVIKGNPPKRPSKGPAAPIEIPDDIVNESDPHAITSNTDSHLCDSTAGMSDYSIEIFDNDDNPGSLNHSSSNGKDHYQFFDTDNENNANIIIEKSPSSSHKSNLIEFTSDKNEEKELNDDNDSGNSTQQSAAFLPNLSLLNVNSEDSIKKISMSNSSNFLQELVSSELPLCINDRDIMSSYQESLSEAKPFSTHSNSSDLYSNSCDNLENVNLPEIPNDSSTTQNNNIETQTDSIAKTATYDAAYDELPLTVLEFCKN